LKATPQLYIHEGPIKCDYDAARCVVYRSVVNKSSQIYGLCHRRRQYEGLQRAVLGYGNVSKKANIKLVELVEEYLV
jgi:hypothetical protein